MNKQILFSIDKYICENLLIEGGNVFSEVSPIENKHLYPTLNKFKKNVLFNIGLEEKDVYLLGSAGKKSISKDIDIGIEIKSLMNLYREINTDKIMLRLKSDVTPFVLHTSMRTPKLFQCFIEYPQINEKNEMFGLTVQIDLMVGKRNWLEHWYTSAYSNEMNVENVVFSNYKGVYRNALLFGIMRAFTIELNEFEIKKFALSIAGVSEVIKSFKGIKVSRLKNPKIIDRKFISSNFTEFFKEFFEDKNFKPENILSFELLLDYIQKNKKLNNKYKQIVEKTKEILFDFKLPLPEVLI